MEATLKPGASVWLKLPYGDFVIDSCIREGQDAVLVAGGTGVSPYIPYLASLVAGGASHGKVALYYGARLKSFILFPEVISGCVGKIPGYSATVSIESESSSGLSLPGAHIRDGRLSIDEIRDETKVMNDPLYFLSGPPVMIKSFMQRLVEIGVARENIKIDEWE
jgi:Flavodoxin reductases (ferredoxin-NADPH reductases) family 1